MKKRHLGYIIAILIVVIIAIILLFSYGKHTKGTKDLHNFIAKLKTRQLSESQVPTPSINLISKIIYTPDGKQQPFAEMDISGQTPTIERKTSQNTLEHYRIAQLQVLGVLTTQQQQWALIKTPDNKIYKVTIGSIIGVEKGKIVTIEKGIITIKTASQVVTLNKQGRGNDQNN